MGASGLGIRKNGQLARKMDGEGMKKDRKMDGLQKWLYAAIAAFILAVTGFVLVVMLSPKQAEFVPPEFEAEAENGIPEVEASLGWTEIWQEKMSFKAWVCGEFIVKDHEAALYFTSAKENEVWIKLRIMDEEGNILGESGLLKPGEYVKSVKLERLPEKDAMVTMKIMSYEPETYYSCGAVTLSTMAQIEGEGA